MTKILLVEDDKSLREIYGVRLLAEGYDIVSAGDGEEALAMAIKDRPDLIVSDVMMPKISGFDMLDILRSTTETKDIKVIMMTALSSEEQRQRGVTLGADRYLVKSQVGIEDVVRTVHEVLSDAPISGQAPLMPAAPTTAPSLPEASTAPAAPSPAPMSAPTPMTPMTAGPGAVADPTPTPTTPTPVAPAPSAVPPRPTAPTMPSTPAAPSPAPAQSIPVTAPAQVTPAPAPAPDSAPAAPAAQVMSPSTPSPMPPMASSTPFPAAPLPASTLPEPTAPFSTPRNTNLAARVIQPLQTNNSASPDLSNLMSQELSSAPNDSASSPSGLNFEETPRPMGAPAPAPSGLPPVPPAPNTGL